MDLCFSQVVFKLIVSLIYLSVVQVDGLEFGKFLFYPFGHSSGLSNKKTEANSYAITTGGF